MISPASGSVESPLCNRSSSLIRLFLCLMPVVFWYTRDARADLPGETFRLQSLRWLADTNIDLYTNIPVNQLYILL